MLDGKKIVLGVTGGIACYKSCDIASKLIKRGSEVHVIMTDNSTNFVAPLTFESLTNQPVVTDTFKREKTWDIQHISLAQLADIILVAPATANIIAKVANGICDDMLSTTICATKAKVVFAPAMNTAMYDNPITQANIAKLKSLGYYFVPPIIGILACGDVGNGKMAEPVDIIEYIDNLFCDKQDLLNKRILITLGATQEPIDPVRVITNHSSGKMGKSIAEECIARGAQVTLICGKVTVEMPPLAVVIRVSTTQDMYNATLNNLQNADYIIMAAAPADYRVSSVSDNKIKADKVTLNLIKNPDIAAEVGKLKGNAKLVIFSAETENLIVNAKAKLVKKCADIVVANDVTLTGAGFNTDTNIVSIINANGEMIELPILTKREVAERIVEAMIRL